MGVLGENSGGGGGWLKTETDEISMDREGQMEFRYCLGSICSVFCIAFQDAILNKM